VLLALSTGQKLGLGGVAAAYIAFSLVSALVIPRLQPAFPGRRLGLFLLGTVALFVAMMAAVLVFGKEEESEAHGETGVETTGTVTGEGPAPPPAEAEGDPQAGGEVFASSGCGSCHTLEAAGTSGTAGPNLDEALQGDTADAIQTSIVDPNAEVAQGFQPNVMPQDYEEQLSDRELADLVAFLAQQG
jgi:mono/diheme cytochrome c family protein